MNRFAIGCGVVLAILLFIVVIAAIALGGSYNRLVHVQQTVDQSWAQVQNVYQRRADLIPNLVNTVAGAANFEKSNIVEVTNARASVRRLRRDQCACRRRRCPTRPKQSADRCGTVGAIPSRPGATKQCALAFAGGGRALSGTACQPEFSQLAGATRRNREPDIGRARKLQ